LRLDCDAFKRLFGFRTASMLGQPAKCYVVFLKL
jgi:hypothetical protein